MNSIEFRIKILEEKIAETLQSSQRHDQSVQLVAVSKTRNSDEITKAHAAGISHFGENRLQEALPKLEALADLPITWHFIGRLQKNKVKKIVQHFTWIESVADIETAEKISRCAIAQTKSINICIQVNIDADPNKAGVGPEALEDLAAAIQTLPQLSLRGLMTVPEKHTTIEADRKSYRHLKQLFDVLNQKGYALDTLSMGMSGDYPVAIEEGSTRVRIGKNLFGPFDD